MSIERIQPDMSPKWEKEPAPSIKKETAPPASQGGTQAAQNKNTGAAVHPASLTSKIQSASQAAAHHSVRKTVWAGNPAEVMSQMQAMVEKLKSIGTQAQVSMQISEVGQSMVITRQELEKASRDEIVVSMSPNSDGKASYWDKLSVSAKARTINRLKDRLHAMELERSRLTKTLSEQVNSGSYQVSGEEILNGMAQET
jgi:hypothetical protein